MHASALALAFVLPAATVAENGGQKPGGAGTAQHLIDPQIADIALTAHKVDIARGKLALSKTKNAEVKQFAEQMVNDHQAGVKEAVALATRLGVKPESNAVSKSLQQDAEKTRAKLSKLNGPAFDRAYIDAEVKYHEAVIDAVKKTLIPSAQNADLKQLLTDVVPTLEGHLQHAKNVQAQLDSGTRAAAK
jgi:putative membrane protein